MGGENNPLSEAAKILESEVATNLLSPVTKEIGIFLGDVANLSRFYLTQNLGKVFVEWWQLRAGRTLGDEEFRRVMPLFPVASLVNDSELQKRWAALMESTATDDGYLPSFGQTLAQLTAEEVRYLDRLWERLSDPDLLITSGRLSHINLVQIFDPNINTGVNPAEMRVFEKRFTEEQKANYERFMHAKLVIEDLIRLGIIREDHWTVAPPHLQADEDGGVPLSIGRSSMYSASKYGTAFMRAVTAKPGDDTAT